MILSRQRVSRISRCSVKCSCPGATKSKVSTFFVIYLWSFDALAINALRSFDVLATWGHQCITLILVHWRFGDINALRSFWCIGDLGAFTYYVQIGSFGDLEQTFCVHLEISTIHTYPWRAREEVRGSSFSEGNSWVKFSGNLETHSSAFMQGGRKEQYHVI